MTRGFRLALWGLLAAALFAYSAAHISFTTDVTNFMPDGRGAELARISRELAHSDLARTMVLTLSAEEPARAVSAAKQLAAALRTHPEVAWLRSGADAEFQQGFFELYFPRRHAFLSDAPARELPQLLSDEGLRARAAALRDQLALPVAPLLKRIAREDPLGAFPALLARLAGGATPLATQDGVFVSADGRWAVIFLATRHSAFDSVAQRPLLAEIERQRTALKARHGADLVLEVSGANRFAIQAEDAIRRDASLISTLSMFGVMALFLLFFRSLPALVIALAPALAGILVALASGLFVFGKLDGMTIAFGASLIGATIDYPVHVLNLWTLAPPGSSPWGVTRRLRISLTMAALTTMASFAGLGVTAFPGFRELGFFATVGIAGALLATLLLLPDLLPASGSAPPLAQGVAARLGAALLSLRRHRAALALVPVAALAVGAFAIPQLRWDDDLSRLGQPDPALQAEEARVRSRISNFEGARFVIVLADSAEQALQRNEAVYARLAALVADGALAGVRSLHGLLWSESLQRENLTALRASPDLARRLDAAFRATGFKPGAFAPFADALAEEPAPLTLAELRASPLGELAGSLVLELEGRTAVISYLREVRDPAAVARALADLPDVHFFEQRTFLNDVYARFRDQTLQQVAIGSALVLALLLARYRDVRRAVAAFLPSALVAVLVLSALALLGQPVNLLHAVSLLIVMGMGVDYGIYVVDGVANSAEMGATLLSILLCCLTTLCGFGTLALSDHPALRAIGLTTGIGILLSMLLAPLTLLILRADIEPARAA